MGSNGGAPALQPNAAALFLVQIKAKVSKLVGCHGYNCLRQLCSSDGPAHPARTVKDLKKVANGANAVSGNFPQNSGHCEIFFYFVAILQSKSQKGELSIECQIIC